ncbi:flagellar protein G [Haladaptatus sp. R4]|uniref:flagellar protein G n=1 Tax=Haladaptatus sp. R4 TaxID=1679489 RepID=UPI0007B476C9|nr:flagellar protein G [Haladaptatus sp. R4]KZN23600.1 flagellar protein G [Haladaptatus sp. R4]
MASVSTSHLILFIASLIIAASVAGTFSTGIQRLSGALGDRSIDISHNVRTDIEIISDPASGAVYNASGNENITLLIKNTGSENLKGSSDQIDVLLDGKYQSNVSVEVVDGTYWDVGNVARVIITPSTQLPPGNDHRVKLIVNGDSEVLEFRS